jgi:hypothetical protein
MAAIGQCLLDDLGPVGKRALAFFVCGDDHLVPVASKTLQQGRS